MARPGQDVRIWRVQDRRGSQMYKSRPWVARWRVETRRFQRTFRTRDEADHFRSELLVAQRNGENFDDSTGEPSSWAATGDVSCHDWVRRYLAEQWEEWAPRTRSGTVEEMSRLVPLLIKPSAPPAPDGLRIYLKDALTPGAPTNDRLEAWLGRWSFTLDQLDRSVLAEVDRQLGIGVSGRVLSPTTAVRYRKAARACLQRAVDLELLDRNPWPPPMRGARNRKVRRKARAQAVDIKRLPDPATMQLALDALINHQPASRMYHVMSSTMAYAGLRPSEVVMLRPRALMLPAEGWGRIDVAEADISWDEPGDPKTGEREVPIPDRLVATLAAWLELSDLKSDELIFRSRNDGRPSPSNWGRAWRLALDKVNHERLRVYDLRHFAATSWLHAGVPLGETARRMGHSVETLVANYVGALKGDETSSNLMIDRYLAPARTNG